MKVLHISSPKTWRGGEQQLIYLVEELMDQGLEQLVMCPFNSEVHKYCLKRHIPHITYFKGFSGNPMVAFRVSHICKREGIDLIHVHDSHAHNFAVLSAVLTNNPVPLIVSRRVDFPIQDSSMSLYKYNHPKIARILCVSNAIKTIMEEFIEDKSKLQVVHSGVDLDKFKGVEPVDWSKELDVKVDVPIIGNVAALAPHKDYFTFVDTAKQFLDDGGKAQFVAIGDGPSRKEVEQYIKEQEMADHITLMGFRTDVLSLLAGLDVFLITSETEGLGTSILDALALKVPVVATAAGGIVEVVEHEKTGLLCPVKAPKELAEACQRMVTDDALRLQCQQGGAEKVQLFSKRVTAAKTREVYASVCGA
jgi:glycosyltransferase involved in cell wall biosynthesis